MSSEEIGRKLAEGLSNARRETPKPVSMEEFERTLAKPPKKRGKHFTDTW